MACARSQKTSASGCGTGRERRWLPWFMYSVPPRVCRGRTARSPVPARLSGAISAGCVESDLIEWAHSVLADGAAKLVTYDVADADAMRIGLTCGGRIDVLIENVGEYLDEWTTVFEAVANDRAVALAVALSPDEMRGRRIFLVDEAFGTIDPAVDGQVVDAMRRQAIAGGSANIEIAGGREPVRAFVEAIAPPPRLIVVGATQIALPLCRMARELDFHVTVIDPRDVYASAERLSDANIVVREWPDRALQSIELGSDTYVVTLTHDEKFDLPTLRHVLRSKARYVGALGSRRTHETRLAALREDGFSEEELARIHSPVGLDLGGRAPAEIALSILAEVTAVRFGNR